MQHREDLLDDRSGDRSGDRFGEKSPSGKRSPEAIEDGLDRFIDQRHAERERAEQAGEERSLDEQVRDALDSHHANVRRENGARWYSFHLDLAELHRRLAAEHEQKAMQLLENGG